jgi:hypothetical protein
MVPSLFNETQFSSNDKPHRIPHNGHKKRKAHQKHPHHHDNIGVVILTGRHNGQNNEYGIDQLHRPFRIPQNESRAALYLCLFQNGVKSGNLGN